MNLEWPARLSLANTPTPLQPLRRFCATNNLPTIWLKRDDMTHSLASGNKIRKLEFCLAEALEQRADVLITYGGVQSNHCRATAILGAQLGLQVHLVLRGPGPPDELDGNLLLNHLAGAQISYFSGVELAQRGPEIEQSLRDHYSAQGLRSYCIPIGASDATGLWGYVAACEELATDFTAHDIKPEHIVVASGSGGTQSGLIAGAKLFELGCEVVGINICDDASWFENKISADLCAWQEKYAVDIDPSTLNINMIDGYVGEGYAKAGDEVFQLITTLAQTEGVILDPVYTGKAFYGLLQELAKGRFAQATDIVFVHTGGLFGVYPYKDRFAFS